VQACGRGSPELPALAGPRDERSPGLTDPDDEPIRIPIEDALDLHAFAPRDIPSVVAEYLDAAHERGYREVRLIHGRGIGVQRRIVRSVLATHRLVTAFADAPPERGGPGATIVTLRASR
jgi:DNA-nicking Smr family endonuclease